MITNRHIHYGSKQSDIDNTKNWHIKGIPESKSTKGTTSLLFSARSVHLNTGADAEVGLDFLTETAVLCVIKE